MPPFLGACSPAGMALTAASTAGVAAVQERGFLATLDDSTIKGRIGEAFLMASEAIFLAVTVRVHEGRVLLVGALDDPALRARAVDLAKAQPGVREVIDELQPGEGSVAAYAQDAWITAQVNARFTFDLDIYAVNYSVDTVGRVVYLMGIADDQRELDRAVDHARRIRYVKKVVSHVMLKTDPRRPRSQAAGGQG
ncbi:MAG: BON domain-containing protein [Rhodospirillales bacterium]|nr:BON domain-containing protein [Rhodospirillales bacterium]